MRAVLDDIANCVVRAACAGLLLSAAEIALATAAGRDLFLSSGEVRRFAGAALASGVSISLLVALSASLVAKALQPGSQRAEPAVFLRRVSWVVTGTAWPLSLWVLVLLTAGRRVRDLPGRVPVCVLLALAFALVLSRFVRHLVRVGAGTDRRARLLHAAWLGTWALGALALDALVLRRLYPAFHYSLSVFAWLAAPSALLLAPRLRMSAWAVRAAAGAGLVAAFAAPVTLHQIVQAPNVRFAIEETAPLTGKLLRAFRSGAPALGAPASGAALAARAHHRASSARPGIDLRGQDILLITIDALRADRLRAYGGSGRTPELDAFAAQSIVFTHAYTPTPHTSYAVGSLLTGKYLRPVLSLPNGAREHATLPRMLRHYGYRTAGFYPPAIFFVDQERFASLHADRFGLEYVKEMFAPASARVEQVQHYLEHVEPGHPVFVWVHLFEPHEPYEPPPEFRHGERPIELYDGEVQVADRAAGELIRAFRASRPTSTVIVTADHGEEFGEHGGYHHGTSLYEEQVHVPLLWSSAGKTTPRTVAAPVELVDLATTLLAGLGVPRDARMRGDDLGALLAYADAPGADELRAFASIDELRMLSDGRYKALCDARAGSCRAYDLTADPGELHPLDSSDAHLASLRAELSDLVASLPRVEALALQGGSGWPSALARARLGDGSVGPEILPLLGSERADIRAEAVWAVARLGLVQAKQVIENLVEHDADPHVRDEAAVCLLVLGDSDGSARDRVLDVQARARKNGASGLDLARRAAAALARLGAAEATPVLIELAQDPNAEEGERIAAFSLLATLRAGSAVPALIDLLNDVRLRAFAARTLGAIGGRSALDAIAFAFGAERYPEAREAQARALVAQHDPRASRLLIRFLGTDSGVPSGVQSLIDAGTLARRNAWGADLREAAGAALRSGAWSCDATTGCVPGADAGLRLRAAGSHVRVIARVSASGSGQWLELGGQRVLLLEGTSEPSVQLTAAALRTLTVQASSGVRVIACVAVPVTEDIAPPAPTAYDAGVDSGSSP